MLYPYEPDKIGQSARSQVVEYRRVAVADDFFDIISSVHINERGVHVGQKKTYKAVSLASGLALQLCRVGSNAYCACYSSSLLAKVDLSHTGIVALSKAESILTCE